MEMIGHQIAAVRGGKRWTQSRLASAVGISQSTLSDIENDKTSPTWALLVKMAHTLELPVPALLPLDAITAFDNERRLWQELVRAKDQLLAERDAVIQTLRSGIPA